MENSFQTSFIPKKPIVSNSLVRKEPVNFFFVVSTFLFIISILGSVGLFGYKIYLQKQRDNLSSSLSVIRDSFEKETIDELNLFYDRTRLSKDILSKHVALSSIFGLLGDLTIPQVQYTNFSEQISEKEDILTITLSGIAFDYRSIALQADVFNEGKGTSLRNVLFSNLTKDKNNNVSFDLKFDVDPSIYSYEKNITSEGSTPLPEVQESKTP